MRADVIIERFTHGDPAHARAFAEINREWLTQYFVVEPTDEAMFAHPERDIINAGGEILFARLGTDIVGTGALLKGEDGMYEIAKMGVTASARGQGVGRKIAERLIARARELGARKLYIASNRTLDRAIALYRSLGFEEISGACDRRYARCDITLEMDLAPAEKELGGRGGPDPARYGDWEIAGKCVDF